MDLFDIEDPRRPPIRCTIPLSFPEADTVSYPWLKKDQDRYYWLEKPLDKGGFSTAFSGFPCDAAGIRIRDAEDVVVKIPNLSSNRTSAEVLARLIYVQSQSIAEWAHIRSRLLKCKHANPIFDMGKVWSQNPLVQNPLVEIPVTVQPYLSGAVPLNKWLLEKGYRAKEEFDLEGREVPWSGILNWSAWREVATLIADGLAEIHQCRVAHGDIWPPNIYIDRASSTVVFIDFGEAFIMTPTGDPRSQANHAYRAPERGKIEYVPTEQVDVYSFGKLLLYLTIGEAIVILDDPPLYGHARRAHIRKLLLDGDRKLPRYHPEILDIIAQCTALDPVDRPSMLEIRDQLRRLSSGPSSTPPQTDIASRMERLAEASKGHIGSSSGVFGRFINRKADELERLIDSCKTEMVEIHGTRHSLIDSLVEMFSELGAGDSWTTLTTPSVWQGNALGLDGRYMTASIQAVRRGAAVQRIHAISVEELGSDWARPFAHNLMDVGEPDLHRLGKAFDKQIKDYEYSATAEDFKSRTEEFQHNHRERFACVIESLRQMVDMVDAVGGPSHVCTEQEVLIKETRGLYLGLVPVGTLAKVRELRTRNPVSLLYIDKEATEHDKWLLVMTDIRGRNEYESGSTSRPQLLGVRAYKSVMGVPEDRILGLQRLMREQSINIGRLTSRIIQCLPPIQKA